MMKLVGADAGVPHARVFLWRYLIEDRLNQAALEAVTQEGSLSDSANLCCQTQKRTITPQYFL